MELDGTLVTPPIFWTSQIVYGIVLSYAGFTAHWGQLQNNERLHVYLGTIVTLLLLWNIRGGILPGLNFHLLGVTAVTLMVRWRFAFIAVTITLAGFSINGHFAWQTLAINALVLGGVPILTTEIVLRLAQRCLPLNLFIYVFINAFLAGGLSALAVGSAKSGLLVLSGTYDWDQVSYDYLVYLPMMFIAEALINGWLIVIFVVYWPHWVDSFDDERYLR